MSCAFGGLIGYTTWRDAILLDGRRLSEDARAAPTSHGGRLFEPSESARGQVYPATRESRADEAVFRLTLPPHMAVPDDEL